MTNNRRETGIQGEQIAIEYLRSKGYTIVTTNWRSSSGEIDIVAHYRDTLVFVEVRSRHAASTEAAFESITPRKREKLQQLAYHYLDQTDQSDASWRIDVIAVALRPPQAPIVRHVEDALDW